MKMLNEARYVLSRRPAHASGRASSQSCRAALLSWSTHTPSELVPVSSQNAVSIERSRVWRHIDGAERAARKAQLAPSHLDRWQQLNRQLLLDELRDYKNAGRYPLNRVNAQRKVPQFIDGSGTRCAMAHLIEITGHGRLVRHIANTENGAYVRQLARHATVRQWLAATGLSMQEAARIQPSYCFLSEAEACFCNQASESSVMLGTVLSVNDDGVATVRLDRVNLGAGGAGPEDTGDEVQLETHASVGDQLLVTAIDYGSGYHVVGAQLTIEQGQVVCSVNNETKERPVSVETAVAALEAEGYDCIDILKNDDSDWNQSQCQDGYPGEGGDGDGDGDGGSQNTASGGNQNAESGGSPTDASGGNQNATSGGNAKDGGCMLADPGAWTNAPPITSLAILVALLARRGYRVVRRAS